MKSYNKTYNSKYKVIEYKEKKIEQNILIYVFKDKFNYIDSNIKLNTLNLFSNPLSCEFALFT